MLQSEKDRLTDAAVTLNGMPAAIKGRLEPFAILTVPTMPEIELTYCWETARRIVDHFGGAFVSPNYKSGIEYPLNAIYDALDKSDA